MNGPDEITPTIDTGKDINMNATQTIIFSNERHQKLTMAAEAVRALVSVVFVTAILFPAALSFVAAGTPALA